MFMSALPDNTYNFSYYVQPADFRYLEVKQKMYTDSDNKQSKKLYHQPIKENVNSNSYLLDTFNATHFQSCVDNAIERYKRLNNITEFDDTPAYPFLSVFRGLGPTILQCITFYEDAINAQINFNNQEFDAEYNYNEPDSMFVSTFKHDTLYVKDGNPADLLQILRSF
ncbi:hypothetical protein ACYULU_06215 [Breznakiellaceae bacterium SP9]